MSEVIISTFVLSIKNELLDTKIKKNKMDIWGKVRLQLEVNLDLI